MNVMAFQNITPGESNYASGLMNLLRNIGPRARPTPPCFANPP